MGILQSNGPEKKHENDLCFWGSRFDCMNDAYDSQYALQLPMKIFNHYHPNEKIPRTIFPYVVSFCKKKDYLNMWRLYSSYIYLKLDKNQIEKSISLNNKYLLHDCVYPPKDKISAILESLTKILNTDDLNNEVCLQQIQCASAFIKHYSFQVEEECRLVYFCSGQVPEVQQELKLFKKDVCIDNTKDICFRTENNRLIPYHKFYLPKTALKGIIVREYDDEAFERVKEHICLVLHKVGITNLDKKIEKSGAEKIIETKK